MSPHILLELLSPKAQALQISSKDDLGIYLQHQFYEQEEPLIDQQIS